jgi:hypothetical protein
MTIYIINILVVWSLCFFYNYESACFNTEINYNAIMILKYIILIIKFLFLFYLDYKIHAHFLLFEKFIWIFITK